MGEGNEGKMEEKMSEERRKSEKERRELARAHAGEVVEDSSILGTPRLMSQMVSVRLDGKLAMELWDAAERRGVTLSDILREGAKLVLQEEHDATRPEVSFRISGVEQKYPTATDHDAYAVN
jgi:hypothetical protein